MNEEFEPGDLGPYTVVVMTTAQLMSLRKTTLLSQMRRLFPLFLYSCISCEKPEVCYPWVVRHRIDSILPTSHLFCVNRQNDAIEYEHLEIVQTEEQWNDYSARRNVGDDSVEIPKKRELVEIRIGDRIRPLHLPASISSNSECSGTQIIEWSRNLTIRCKTQLTKCESLGVGDMFGETLVWNGTNIPYVVHTPLVQPKWNGSACIGAPKLIVLEIRQNRTNVIGVELSVEYSTIGGDAYERQFRVEFVEWRPPIANESLLAQYRDGEPIFAVNGIVAMPLVIPSLSECNSRGSKLETVKFKRFVSTVCELATTSCEHAKSASRAFYANLFPREILSAPTDDSEAALVHRVNTTWDEKAPSSGACRLPVAALFEVYVSRQGTTREYRELIVAASVQLSLDYIVYNPGDKLKLPITIKFTEIIPKPISTFASLPYIDLRLPYDFFYPFIKSSANCSISMLQTLIFLEIVSLFA
ncbi:unnamed protein product [Caenorhabditis bovis]|uniref:Tectonic domain-containing protein n=1 Tax=Caenorhabditis bovis TaxID=2654633 RepID=A0A8S1F1L1_9PELO|nr:unnamed protein product [Caenorhabditis bovis]